MSCVVKVIVYFSEHTLPYTSVLHHAGTSQSFRGRPILMFRCFDVWHSLQCMARLPLFFEQFPLQFLCNSVPRLRNWCGDAFVFMRIDGDEAT